MRVTYLTGQSQLSVQFGPIVIPAGGEPLPVGLPGQIVSYDAAGLPIAINPSAAAVTIDPDPDNALEARANGLFVGAPILSSQQW